jgi:hypothetical protein
VLKFREATRGNLTAGDGELLKIGSRQYFSSISSNRVL